MDQLGLQALIAPSLGQLALLDLLGLQALIALLQALQVLQVLLDQLVIGVPRATRE